MSKRDTQFAGFAKLLWNEFMANEVKYWDRVPEELERRRLIIAQRAYDFACHVVTYLDEDFQWRMGKGYSASQIVENDVPDMTAWPEDAS